jgi:hypothetical protein
VSMEGGRRSQLVIRSELVIISFNFWAANARA